MSILWFYRSFLRVVFARLRHAFRFKEIWQNKYEFCNRCGCFYTIAGDWENSIWLKINGRHAGTGRGVKRNDNDI